MRGPDQEETARKGVEEGKDRSCEAAGLPITGPCLSLLDRYGVPEHIRRHSRLVAAIARKLGEDLRAAGEDLDEALLERAALLHDIAKERCLRSTCDHSVEGGRILRAEGLGREAELVERHVRLGDWSPEGAVTAAEILNYSDKRVKHTEVVGLSDRFDDLAERYGRDDDGVRSRIEANRRNMTAVEEKIFRRLPYGPERIR